MKNWKISNNYLMKWLINFVKLYRVQTNKWILLLISEHISSPLLSLRPLRPLMLWWRTIKLKLVFQLCPWKIFVSVGRILASYRSLVWILICRLNKIRTDITPFFNDVWWFTDYWWLQDTPIFLWRLTFFWPGLSVLEVRPA
jgi:hypothetical protein